MPLTVQVLDAFGTTTAQARAQAIAARATRTVSSGQFVSFAACEGADDDRMALWKAGTEISTNVTQARSVTAKWPKATLDGLPRAWGLRRSTYSLALLLACSACSDNVTWGARADRTDSSTETHLEEMPSQAAVFRVGDQLVLGIPPQYQRFWLQGPEVVRTPVDISQVPVNPSVGFSFFLPGFTGYSRENFRREFDESRVGVISISHAGMFAAQPGAAGQHPANMLGRLISSGQIDPTDSTTVHGLRCYPLAKPQAPGSWESVHECFGVGGGKSGHEVRISVTVPPYPRHVQLASYFAPHHGGINVLWRTHVRNLARWAEIDQQVWRFLNAWNLVR